MPRARNGRYGGLGNRTARVPGRWVRWIGWIAVWDAERDLCGVEHMEHAQPYVPTATENGTAGRGDIHTNAIVSKRKLRDIKTTPLFVSLT